MNAPPISETTFMVEEICSARVGSEMPDPETGILARAVKLTCAAEADIPAKSRSAIKTVENDLISRLDLPSSPGKNWELGTGSWQLPHHILYLPRSSSPRSSSHLRSSSLFTAGTALAACFELFRTSSSTKMGQSTRNASASASDGRESMLTTWPSLSSQITA